MVEDNEAIRQAWSEWLMELHECERGELSSEAEKKPEKNSDCQGV
jgi:hypothetical protein